MEPLRAGQNSELIIKIFNPTQYQTIIKLNQFNFGSNNCDKIHNEDSAVTKQVNLIVNLVLNVFIIIYCDKTQ